MMFHRNKSECQYKNLLGNLAKRFYICRSGAILLLSLQLLITELYYPFFLSAQDEENVGNCGAGLSKLERLFTNV